MCLVLAHFGVYVSDLSSKRPSDLPKDWEPPQACRYSWGGDPGATAIYEACDLFLHTVHASETNSCERIQRTPSLHAIHSFTCGLLYAEILWWIRFCYLLGWLPLRPLGQGRKRATEEKNLFSLLVKVHFMPQFGEMTGGTWQFPPHFFSKKRQQSRRKQSSEERLLRFHPDSDCISPGTCHLDSACLHFLTWKKRSR